MKKRIWAMVLAVAMGAILLLAGCSNSGSSSEPDTSPESSADVTVEIQVETESPAEETQEVTETAEAESEFPTNEEILSDLPEELQSISIFDPVQLEETVIYASGVELERRLTEGTSDAAYYKITYENDYYVAAKYMTFYSTNYTVGGWILDSYEAYESNEFLLKANPFNSNDIYALVGADYYDEFELSEPVIDSEGSVTYSYIGRNYYTYVDETTEGEYSFIMIDDEFYWYTGMEENTSYEWDIVGTWQWTDFTITSDNNENAYDFILTIDSFDSDSLTGTGYYLSTNSNKYYDLSRYCDFADSEISIKYEYDEDSLFSNWTSYTGVTDPGEFWLEIICNRDSGLYGGTVYIGSDEAAAITDFGYGPITRNQ